MGRKLGDQMSNVYDMLGHKKVLFDEEVKDITYKEIMTIIVQRATEEGCKEIFSEGRVTLCPSKVFEPEQINVNKEEKDCEEGIGCTKCWTKAVKKLRGD